MSDVAIVPDHAWYAQQVTAFCELRSRYQQMADCVGTALQGISRAHDVTLMIQTRAKDVAGFAEKILRPGKHFTDPLSEMGDLWGARVIAHTLTDVEIVSRYIKEHFDVLPEESDDAVERLKAVEFGYLSRHFEVRLKPGAFPEAVVPSDLVALRLKGEIQVRTILQHAWADVAHEASYKSSFELPRRWARELAQLAAVLEAADVAFDRLQGGLKEYAASYGAYFDEKSLHQQIERVTIALERDPNNQEVAHRLARMAMSLGEWRRAVDVLEPFSQTANPALLRDLGISMCKLHARSCEGSDYAAGQVFVSKATELDPRDVDAWASLAGTWRTRQHAASDEQIAADYRRRARDFYRKAFEVDAGDPYALGNFIEYELAEHPDIDLLSYLRPSLEKAIGRCLSQIEVGVNMPWAYFDLGKFHMLMGAPYAALEAYARGVASSSAGFFIESALRSFRELGPAQGRLPGFDWIKGFLELACSIRFGSTAPSVSNDEALPGCDPTVIIAGYTSKEPTDLHRTLLQEAFASFRGRIISGGTRAGVCQLVGELQAAHPDSLHTIGYIPRQIPPDVALDERYKELRRSAGADFSPLEVLLYWRDLHRAGCIPQVRFLAVGGGRIAAAECTVALALGVPVGIVAEADGGPAKLLADPSWMSHPRLRALAADAGALRAFLEG